MDLKIVVAVIILILAVAVGIGIYKMTGNSVKQIEDSNKVLIETNFGEIVVELYPDKAPITVENFKKYVKEEFYSGTIFHRVIDGFMIQGGGFNTNGEEKEIHASIKLESDNGLKNNKGTIAMARTNIPDSATSQFFINTQDNEFLNYGYRDEGYAVFGKVIKGMDVVDKIAKVQTDSSDKPLKDVVIKKVVFVE